MELMKGDMLANLEYADYNFITTNPIVTNDGRAVMGAGIAKQVRDKYPGIDRVFARRLELLGPQPIGIIDEVPELNTHLCWFMVKSHWAEPASLDIIHESVWALHANATFFYDKTFYLNFPGIGCGGLAREDVLPLLEELPENVFVWEL